MAINEEQLAIFKTLLKAPFSHSKSDNGPLDFPNPDKQAKDILSVYINNEISKAEISLAHTYSHSNLDLADVKLTNVLTLYQDSDKLKTLTMMSFYLLRLKALSTSYDKIPLELLPLQKLGYYESLAVLSRAPIFNEDSEFLKRFPKAFARLKHALGEYPFFIKVSTQTVSEECVCYENATNARTSIAESDCKNEDNAPDHTWICEDVYHGMGNTAEETAIIQQIEEGFGLITQDTLTHEVGIAKISYGGLLFGFYDDLSGKTVEDLGPDINIAMPWSIIHRSVPKINAYDWEVTNFTFEHYKTRWAEQDWPDGIIMSPKQFLVEAGYIPSNLDSLDMSLNKVQVTSLATYIQTIIWDSWEKDSDLKILFSPEAIALGMKLLAGHLFVPRSQLIDDFSQTGYTFGDDPLLPAGAAINANSSDIKISGTFTTLVIDPNDRKYIEDQYYRYRANKEIK